MSETEEASPLAFSPGEVIDTKFRVEAKLGEGGMGIVLRVRHLFVDKEYAIKILTVPVARRDMAERFKLEARASNIIGHPAFVETFDFGTYRNQPYIVMEHLEGENLGALVRKEGPLSIPRGTAILAHVADALEAAHSKGIIHRDIKGENIFLLPGDVVKILDLGIAKFLNDTEHTKTRTGAVFGTPYTMSPEQIRSSDGVDPRSDIYSLAVVGFYLLSGRWPYAGDDWAVMSGHMNDPVPRLSDVAPHVPVELSEIIRRNMSKSPLDRDRSMRVFADSLAPFASGTLGGGAGARTVPLPPPYGTSTQPGHLKRASSAAARSRRTGLLVGAGVVAAAIVGVVLALRIHQPSEPEKKMPAPVPAAEMFKLIIDVDPADATVEVDGRTQAGSPPYFVEAQNGHLFHVTASKDGFSPASRDVKLQSQDDRVTLRLERAAAVAPASAPTAVPAAPSVVAKGRLDVIVDPYAMVYVDAKKIGQTPQRIQLPVGSHKVKLVNAEFGHPADKPFEQRVQIRAGKTETIELTWTR